jgi:hypothetical protein
MVETTCASAVVVGQHVAPGAHQREVGLAVGQALGQAFPAVHGAQLHGAAQALRQVRGQRAVGGVVLLAVGLEHADAQAERAGGRGGMRPAGAVQGRQGAERGGEGMAAIESHRKAPV